MEKLQEGYIGIVKNNRFIVRFPDLFKEIKSWSVSGVMTPDYDFATMSWSDSEIIIREHVSHKLYSTANELIKTINKHNKLNYSDRELTIELEYFNDNGEVLEKCYLLCRPKQIKFSDMEMDNDECTIIKLIFTTIDFNIELPK